MLGKLSHGLLFKNYFYLFKFYLFIYLFALSQQPL